MNHLQYLAELLENEINAYNELLALAMQEKDAVIKNDVQFVSVIVEKQQCTLAIVKKLEAERENALCAFRKKAGLSDGGRLCDVIKTDQGAMGEKLKRLVKELESTAAKLRRAGALNKMLIDTQLQYTSFCINLLAGGEHSLNTYSGSGMINEGCTNHHRLVDQTV